MLSAIGTFHHSGQMFFQIASYCVRRYYFHLARFIMVRVLALHQKRKSNHTWYLLKLALSRNSFILQKALIAIVIF